jgi:hypothetical protein
MGYGGYRRQVYVQLADGTSPRPCGRGVYPAYRCRFAGATSTDDCMRLIRAAVLAAWAPYNLDVTFDRPAARPYYHIMVSSSGIAAGYSSAACFDAFTHPDRGACFDGCGADVDVCAAGIVHEVGHLMGLGHVEARTDVMFPSLCTHDGTKCNLHSKGVYEDKEYPSDHCGGRLQNSHRQVLSTVGPRR